MKLLIFLSVVLLSASVWSASLTASNTAKSYEGQNGEKVDMIEVNNGKEVVVRVSGIGGDWEGKTFLWHFEDQNEKKNIFTEIKHGSKTERYNTLTFRNGQWEIYTKGKPDGISINFSKTATEKLKSKELLSSYKE